MVSFLGDTGEGGIEFRPQDAEELVSHCEVEWCNLNVGGHPLVWERPQDTPKVCFSVVSRRDAKYTVSVRHLSVFLYVEKVDPFGALSSSTHKTCEVIKEALARVGGGPSGIPLGWVIQ